MGNCAFDFEEGTRSYQQLVNLHGPIVAAGIMSQYNGRPPRRFYEASVQELEEKQVNETQRFTETEQREIVDSITYQLITQLQEQGVQDMLGTGTERGTIPTTMLRNAYIVEATGEIVSAERAKELYAIESKLNEAYHTATDEEYDALVDEFEEATADILKDEDGSPTTKDGATGIRETYFDIYHYWNGGISTAGKTAKRLQQDIKSKNNDIVGWRELLQRRVNESGYTLTQTEAGYTEVEDDQEILEKIYGKSSLQEDPSKKLSGKIRQTLSTLPSGKKTFLGYDSFIDADTVYRDLAKEFSGAPNFPSMKLRLKNLSKHKPQYAPVYEFMEKMDRKQAAQFRSAFGLSAREFVMMRVGVVDGNVKAITSNPNMNSVEAATIAKWEANAIEGDTPNPNAVYTKNDKGVLSYKNPGTVQIVKSEAKVAIEAAYTNVDPTTTDGSLHPAVMSYAAVTHTLGINLSKEGTLEAHARAVQSLVNNGQTVSRYGNAMLLTGADMFNYLVLGDRPSQSLVSMLNGSVVDLDVVRKKVVYKGVPSISNLFKTNKQAIAHIARFAPMFQDNKGDAFVNMVGNVIHPINLPHNLSRMVEAFQTPGARDVKAGTIRQDALDVLRSSKFHKPGIGREHQSALLTALESDAFAKEFKVETLDALREFGDIADYENFAERQSLTARLQAYHNNGNAKLAKIALPTQADRTNIIFVTVPRFSNESGDFGTDVVSKRQVLKDLIIQDLVRIAEAEKVVGRDGSIRNQEVYDRNENYYKNGKAAKDESMQLFGTGAVSNRELNKVNNQSLDPRMSNHIQTYIEARHNNTTSDIVEEIDSALEEMVEGTLEYLEGQTDELVSQMDRLGIVYGERGFFTIKDANGELVNRPIQKNKATSKAFAEAFVFDDMVGRLELAKVFRGPIAQFKNAVDFYKRMALVTTPGLEVATEEDLANSPAVEGIPNYGMPNKFTELVLEDFHLDLTPQQIERTNAKAVELRDAAFEAAVLRGATTEQALKEAELVERSYRQNDGVEATDGQSFITLKHYRDIQQGLGSWGRAEEEAYKAYEATGRFEYQEGFTPTGFKPGDAVPMNPMKPFYEHVGLVDGVLSTDETKNSYSVLLRAETEGNPMKDALRRRMEDPARPIDVVNFKSTKKGRKSNVESLATASTDPAQQAIELEAKLNGVQTNVLESKSLRFPQIIPTKKSDLATFNRQVRKNTLANIKDDAMYVIDGGTAQEQEVSGEDLKKLYHDAINRKIDLDMARLYNEIGISKLDAAKTPEARKEALQNIHQNLRRIITEENMERDLPDNYNRGLQIIEDAAGRPGFELSLDFPVYFEKIERIVLGMAVNRAFKQKISGQEAVQVADLGGYGESNELEFYTADRDSKGRPRLSHMEVAVRADIARKLGIEEGQELTPEQGRMIGYRIPNQGKSSTILMRVKKILPDNYAKAIIVPGQITTLTGSDFDIDKMILIFPEMRKTDAGLTKVRPPYKALVNGETSMKRMDESILNNIIYDTIEAVQSSPQHFNETLAPLDETTLESIVAELEASLGLDSTINFNDYMGEINSGIRNTLGVALRGLWANALAGHSVAQHGSVNVLESAAISIDGERFTKLQTYAPETAGEDAGTPINMVISRYLSAAVDAGNKPYQFTLNDNVATLPVELYWITHVGDTRLLHYYLNHPTIREATDLVLSKYGGNVYQFKKAFEEVLGDKLDGLDEGTVDMSSEAILNGSVSPRVAAANFMKFLNAGQELQRMFKVIAPDSMDGMNSADSLKSYESRRNKFSADTRMRGESIYYGRPQDTSPVEQFLEKDGPFGMSGGFNALFNSISNDLGAKLMPKVFSPAMRELEIQYMEALGKDQVRPEELKELRRAAMLHVVTRPGSPMREFFSRTHLETRYLNKQDNLVTQFGAITTKNPKLKENKFIAKFTENKDNSTERISLLEFDTSQKMSKFEKDSIIQDARRLMEFPEEYAENPGDRDSVREIQNLVEDLFANALIVNGFRVSNNSYADMIPVEFFLETRHSRYGQEGMQQGERFPKSVSEFYKEQNLEDLNYFGAFMGDYLRQHGTRYAGGSPIIPVRKMKAPLLRAMRVKGKISELPLYRVFANTATEERAVYRLGNDGVYYKLNPLGGRIMESYDVGVESEITKVQRVQTPTGTDRVNTDSVVSVSEVMGVQKQAPRKTLAPLRQRVTGQDRTDVICK